MSIFKIQNVNTGYGDKQVLFDVSFEVERGESVLLVGSNGSGKSTLLKLSYGLLPIWNDGIVMFSDTPLHSTACQTPTHMLINKGIMYVPQKDELYDDMSVEENLQCSLLHFADRIETERRLKEVFDRVPLLYQKRCQEAGRLSGGERKLLSLGMVIANRPTLLLYDEPLAGLSEENIPTVLDYLTEIRTNGTTIIIVEHRITELIGFVNRIVGLKLGHLYTDNLNTLDDIKGFMI